MTHDDMAGAHARQANHHAGLLIDELQLLEDLFTDAGTAAAVSDMRELVFQVRDGLRTFYSD